MRIAIILPFCGNPDRLDEVLCDIEIHNTHPDLAAYVIFDGQPEIYDLLDEMAFDFKIKKILLKKHSEFVAAANAGIVAAKDQADLFAIWAHDCRILEYGWWERVEESYQKHFPEGGGLLGMNDGTWGNRLATHPVVDRKFIEWLGYPGGALLWPGYVHYGSDNEVTGRAKKAQRWAYDGTLAFGHPPPGERRKNKYYQQDKATLRDRTLATATSPVGGKTCTGPR